LLKGARHALERASKLSNQANRSITQGRTLGNGDSCRISPRRNQIAIDI
jgi:hypothetical protein